MSLRQRLEQRIGRLRALEGATVERCRIGEPVSADDVAVVTQLTGTVPAPLLNLYRQMDGMALGWTLRDEPGGREVAGSLDILPLRQALLGISTLPDGAPFEGVLWNAEYPAAALRKLKPMRVLESVAGEPSFLTFVPDARPLRLFLVYEAQVKALRTEFVQTLELLVHYLGCAGLREALTRKDWARRLQALEPFTQLEKL